MKKVVLMMMCLMSVAFALAQSKYPTADVEKHDVAIIVIDMQNDFVDPKGVLCVAGAKATIPTIQDLIKYGREKNWKIVYLVREHHRDDSAVSVPCVAL
jgi:isochorismate hydrolase